MKALQRLGVILSCAVMAVFAGFSATQTAKAETVKVGVLRYVSSGGLFLAVERGYFKAEGIEVELKFFEAAQPIAVAVVSGDTSFGVTALTGGFYNLAGKGALKIIGGQGMEKKGYEGNLIVASNEAFAKGLTDASKLAGKSVGISQIGSSFHYQIGQIAKAKGFKLSDVSLKPLQSLSNMMAAVKTSQVDAIIIAPHMAKALEKAGEGKIIGRVSDIDEYQYGGLFTSTQIIEKNPELVQKFFKAYQKGIIDYSKAFLTKDDSGKIVFNSDTDKAAEEIAKYVYPGEALTASVPKVKDSAFYLADRAGLDPENIKAQIDWMKENKLVDSSVDADKIIDLTFIKANP
ncbi:ABC transporter substrate-binding protein [Microvirga sp. W0021]|uniref:ABC transporter substrate-binding protein n=1 Tax=Hohaiivirga grylli TaxID=3133970 RepID=A0ABV0BGI7_9HYPH